ncbi:hypothetical protein L1286_16900 [Pseudoalteromonas sp. SMS1]|uniref:hypothetical protein n=1 Tax=Pseudoalteromonas sp. SMS1 TaxID=2908894 RepID=UPI001F19F711|nr:hypothetical protein [Pseudoalteromonas sp. SMS1]MCF2859164.1 hypothetical protein [Pseudoalteromonas sp. SMS1]
MHKPLTNLLIVLTMLVTFIGQSAAYHLMPALEQTTNSHLASAQIQSSAVAEQPSHAVSQDDCCEVDCCESECICPSNACISFAFLHANNRQAALNMASENVSIREIGHPNTLSDALYRPPIFTA